MWAGGKLAAVREWAADNGIDLAESYAYSDSVFDTPLLSAVGHPIVVNPDPSMVVMATLRRWPVRHFDVVAGRVQDPRARHRAAARSLQQFARPQLMPYARFDIDGVDHIPEHGPAILVANHRSYFDAGGGVDRHRPQRPGGALPRQEGGLRRPGVGQLATAMGGIRVERASGSDEPLQAAAAALEAGELVAIMPQGTIPRGPAFFDPVLKGRWGAARLQQLTGAPSSRSGCGAPRRCGRDRAACPTCSTSPTRRRCASASGRRSAGLKGKSLERRHRADHEGDRQAAAAGGAQAADADAGGAGGDLPARLRRATRPPSRRAARAPTDHPRPGQPSATGCARRPPPDACESTSSPDTFERTMFSARAGPEPLDLLVAERVRRLEVDRRAVGLDDLAAHRLARHRRQAEHADAVVLADLVVGRRVGERQRQSPCFLRLVSWMRAKLRAKITTPPRNRGSIAACSRDEPSP